MSNGRPFQFVLVGGVCFSANMVVLYVGSEVLAWHYLSSMMVSIAIANTLGWYLNRLLSFDRSEDKWWIEYGRYMSVSISSTLFSLSLMFLAVSLAGINYLMASASIALLMMSLNYLAHRDWTFRSSGNGFSDRS